MIDLCKIFGVEEGEEFEIIYNNGLKDGCIFKIEDNYIYSRFDENKHILSTIEFNVVRRIKKIIKLPKKKEFTDDELAIMRSLPKEFEWIARDDDGELYIFDKKPKNINGIWDNCERLNYFYFFEHLFKSITSEDEEPIFIDDYVERGAENE
jgi:hypothetical protein